MSKVNMNLVILLILVVIGVFLHATLSEAAESWPRDPVSCMAANIYHEARGESFEGMLMVAQVTLNRVNSQLYPNTICEVVKQKDQFSWYWDGRSDVPKNLKSWQVAMNIALAYALDDVADDYDHSATHYYAYKKVKPTWAKNLTYVATIGNHVFYADTRLR